MLASGIDISAFAFGGFPSTATYAGIEADRVRIGGGLATIDAGDFETAPLLPEAAALQPESLALDGVQVRWRENDDRGFSFFAGASKFLLALPMKTQNRPLLVGAQYMFRLDRNYFDAGLTAVKDPVYADPSVVRSEDAVLRLSYLRRLSPMTIAFADGYRGHGDGGRAGLAFQGQLGTASVSLYQFSRQLPLLSAFNPGERGLQTTAMYRPSELASIGMQLYYVASDVLDRRNDLRGQISIEKSFGSGAPDLYFSYAHEQLVANTLVENVSRLADTLTFAVTRMHHGGFTSLQLDHVISRDSASPNTTQLLATHQQILSSASFLNATLLVQAERGQWGATFDSAVEAPIRGPYYALYGIGAAFRDNRSLSGEGILRLGLSRRILSNGAYGRAEVRIPVRLGLTQSHLNRRSAAIDIGSSLSWPDLRNARALLAPALTPNRFGSIAGTVRFEGKGFAGAVILVNGEPVTESDESGAFSVRHVLAGPATIGIDVTKLEPGLSVAGSSSRDVIVQPREMTSIDFTIARFTTLQGSIVICDAGRPRPAAGARVALVHGDVAIPLQASASGSFQAENIPPGEYEIVLDPTSLPGLAPSDIPRLTIDLRKDVLGYVIRLRCGGALQP